MTNYRLLILSALAFVLAACGASKFYHAENNSYEEKTELVKNMLFIIKDLDTERKPYQRFEAYLKDELNKRGVDVRFLYVAPSDSLYEQKLKDSVLKYNFDFIIKENFQGFTSSGTNIILQSNNSAPFATGPQTDANLSFMGYRKKVKYQLVWKSSCEGIRITLFRSMYKVAGECLINNLVTQNLIPAVPTKNE